MPDIAELTAEIAALKARIKTFAGVKSTAFGDQATTFDLEGAERRLAHLEAQLSAASTGSRTRYAAVSKGL